MTIYRNLTFPTATNDDDQTIGNLLYCGRDEDCGGVGFTDPITGEIISHGATCNMVTCHCECSAEYCLVQPVILNADNTKKNNEVLLDVGCQFQCECKKKCSLPGNWTGAADATALERCTNECTSCVDNPGACGEDEDCIDGVCVESGICTAKKEAMCDDAYAAVSGKKNQRAKCCPDTRYVDRWLLFDHSATHCHSQYHILIIPPLCCIHIMHFLLNTVVVSRAQLESLQHLPAVMFAEHLVLAASQIQEMPLGIVQAHFVCLAKGFKTCPTAQLWRQITPPPPLSVFSHAQAVTIPEAIIPFAVQMQPTRVRLESRSMVYGIAARDLLETPRSMLLDGPDHQRVLSCASGTRIQSQISGPSMFQPPCADVLILSHGATIERVIERPFSLLYYMNA